MANPNSYNRPTLAPRYAGNSILLSNNYPRAASYPYSTFKHILSRPRPRPLAFRSTSAQAFPTIAEQEDMDQGLQMGKHDLDCAKLNGLLCELQKHNRQGQIVTYDRSRGPLGGWAPWLRPIRKYTRTYAPVAARSFHLVPDMVAPLCPHSFNIWRTNEECSMQCRKEHIHGRDQWVFCAYQHDCDFKVIVPPLKSGVTSNVLLQTELIKYHKDLSDDEPEYPPNNQLQLLSSTPSSSSSRTLVGEPSSGSSRFHTQTPSSSKSSPAKHPYTRGHSTRRLNHISEIEPFSLEAQDHPAADRELPPLSLIPYHECNKPFVNLTLDGSMIANGMRAWNSVDGVTMDAWFALYTYANHCNGCRLTFSIDGYRAHLDRDGGCSKPLGGLEEQTNKVNMHPVEVAIPPALHEYHPSSNPVQEFYLLRDLMIGRALLEWNSTEGISANAWRTITTAYVICNGPCRKVRSFDGDCLHRDANGTPDCTRPPVSPGPSRGGPSTSSRKSKGRAQVEEEQPSPSRKGKERAQEVEEEEVIVVDSDDDLLN
ncbi:hypothetical protein FIBSPDRAFT_903135 [Athelia psychrophila]|uniref:Uncharacterized protein n=1 Tax=Athelia psychrophila TaxID=1759441 RepID=A0A167WDC4_9AGAM|nr:hypothetical protein FIBSPDRAFT_903135 [Fibularhizoctonia sp. CBS 109695]